MTSPCVYREARSLCPQCAREMPSRYEEDSDGILLRTVCDEHGEQVEPVERDPAFFKAGYELDYESPVAHLALVVTYRCNMSCRYCYSLSNAGFELPPDRPVERIADFMSKFRGNITLIGGEPTVRDDLGEIIEAGKRVGAARKISLATNGQKIANLSYLKSLRDRGLDFVFLSFNSPDYEPSPETYRRKLEALSNCRKLRIPVWLQRTIDEIGQLQSILQFIEEYRRLIFHVTIRAVKPFGVCRPRDIVFVSDMAKLLQGSRPAGKGTTPFNRYVDFGGRPIKLCSWVNDVARMDPLDSDYIISDDTWTTFHRGMRMDEVLLKSRTRIESPAR